jgi:hypothetical protein
MSTDSGPGYPPPPVRRSRTIARLTAVLLWGSFLLQPGCGRKGPPVPPVPRRPAPVAEFGARQQGDRILISFRLPQLNLDGSPARLREVRVFRRLARVEDAAPEQLARLEKFYSRGAETVVAWQEEAIVEGSDAAGRVQIEDDSGLQGWEPGLLLVYRVLLLGDDSGRWTDSPMVFLEPRSGLEPPVDLRARSDPQGVALEWEPPSPGNGGAPDGLRFNVYRAIGDGVAVRRNPELLAEARFLDPEIPGEGVSFRYTVRTAGVTAHGLVESADSRPAEVSTPKLVRPPPPAQVTAAVTGQHVRLLWYPPDWADLGGFRIYRRSPEDSGFVPVAEVQGSEVMFTDREVRPGIEYLYRVVSFSRIHPQIESETVDPVSARIDANPGSPQEEEE